MGSFARAGVLTRESRREREHDKAIFFKIWFWAIELVSVSVREGAFERGLKTITAKRSDFFLGDLFSSVFRVYTRVRGGNVRVRMLGVLGEGCLYWLAQ